ncbi:MAG: arsenate reductase ArsC [Alphaproteobacteria bacterium]|nr:MAG: arsenate reductase ArsC [Alphaproteobacteria bacterium]
MTEPKTVLVLCTGNSARSILAEALINRLGAPHFRAVSAGSKPKGAVHPASLRLLHSKGYDISGFRSKSWDEFEGPDAPVIDFVVTVCDNAAGETCPIWPGAPVKANWGIPDPADATGTPGEDEAFRLAYRRLEARVRRFLALPFGTLDVAALKSELNAIGAMTDADINDAGSLS